MPKLKNITPLRPGSGIICRYSLFERAHDFAIYSPGGGKLLVTIIREGAPDDAKRRLAADIAWFMHDRSISSGLYQEK